MKAKRILVVCATYIVFSVITLSTVNYITNLINPIDRWPFWLQLPFYFAYVELCVISIYFVDAKYLKWQTRKQKSEGDN
jgi:hypothetical protein